MPMLRQRQRLARNAMIASQFSGAAARIANSGELNRYRFSRSQRAMISSAPQVSLRSFSAITVFSETVAFFTFRSKTFIFWRRCRRRRNSVFRSLQGTTISPDETPPALRQGIDELLISTWRTSAELGRSPATVGLPRRRRARA